MRSATTVLVCAFVAATAGAVRAEIKIKTLDDGTRVIYNETPAQRARRSAARLLPVPRADLAAAIELHARRQGLSSRLVRAVVQTESGYNVRALSRKGAMGLMQLMPETVRSLGVADPYDPAENLAAGTRYLRRLVDRYAGDLTTALAAYNAGPTAVTRHGGVPPFRETRAYVDKVLRLLRSGGEAASARGSAPPEPLARAKKVYLTRDENDVILFTTTPPGSD